MFILGCAGAPGAGVPELSPWTPPDGQACAPTNGNFSLDAVLDSAAAVQAVESTDATDGASLLSAAFDSTGALARLHRVETTLPEPHAQAVEAAIEAHVRGPTSGSRLGRILLEVRGGRVAALRTGPSLTCRPALANERAVKRALAAQYWAVGELGGAVVRLFVDTAGRVERSHVHIGSGQPHLDRAILEAARTARFHPALIDRRPVAVWVQIQLALEPYCPPLTLEERPDLPIGDPCRDGARA